MDYPKIYSPWKKAKAGEKRFTSEWTYAEMEYLSGLNWDGYEKIDGLHIRVTMDLSGFSFEGRTAKVQIPSPLLIHLANLFVSRFNVLYEYFRESLEDGKKVYFYGEGYGGRLPGGSKYRADPAFALFDIRIGEYWLPQDLISAVAGNTELPRAAFRWRGTLLEAAESLLNHGHKFYSKHAKEPDCPIAGLVLRPMVELSRLDGGRIITKLMVKDLR